MRNSRKFWGIFFILAAIYMVVGMIGGLPYIGIFRILLTVVLVWMIIEGVRRRNFYEILIPIAILCVLYKKLLGLSGLSTWSLVWAAALASVGLNMIFGDRRQKLEDDIYSAPEGGGTQETGREIRIVNNFSTSTRYVNSDDFAMARIENTFGTLSVYFDNAIVSGGVAYLRIENAFGLTNLFIPAEWEVQEDIDRAFGSVNQMGVGQTGGVLLTIHGASNFGTVRIYYI